MPAGWQPLAALLLLACPAGGQFSHRSHLAKKIECVVCHAAAPRAAAASENLLPTAETCVSCHPGMKATVKEVRRLTVTKFNHQLHVKLGPTIAPLVEQAVAARTYLGPPEAAARERRRHACTGCHTGLDTSDAVTETVFPHMADCLVCHNRIDPPFSCEKCHDPSPALKPASHTSEWVDVHSARKITKTSCAVCHGRRFTCLGCH